MILALLIFTSLTSATELSYRVDTIKKISNIKYEVILKGNPAYYNASPLIVKCLSKSIKMKKLIKLGINRKNLKIIKCAFDKE